MHGRAQPCRGSWSDDIPSTHHVRSTPPTTCHDGLSTALAGRPYSWHKCRTPRKSGVAGFAIRALATVWGVRGLLNQMMPMTSRLLSRAAVRARADPNLL